MAVKDVFGHRDRELKRALTNRHEREFYNFCVGGRYREPGHNVEVRGECGFSKIPEARAMEIARMADEARPHFDIGTRRVD